jgi:osmotically-inducible protein OsmY
MIRTILILLVLAVGASAQTKATPAQQAAASHKRTNTPAPKIPDAQIEAVIRAKFAKSKKISQDKLTVHVQGGVATIEGHSDVVQHKGTATRMAKSAGAVAVVNKIQLSQAAKDKVNQNLDQGRRRAQVKRGDPRTQQ